MNAGVAAVVIESQPLDNPNLLDEQAGGELRELIGRYEMLRAVVESHDCLQQVWDQTSTSDPRAGAA